MGIEIGQTISHYKILRKLGHGGMGDVYLAENTRLGLKVALKFLAAQLTRDEKAIKRLEHEARAVAELSHPNISRIYDIEEAEGHRFLVLEYLEGETLADRTQRGPLSIEETVRIGKALAEGLAHAHARGIVHRDIKAPNVMLTGDGGVKIMDFGLARMPDATRLTESGEWLGTVPNMSPEQASGTVADERSDLWSLGVVLYQCITGRFPFEGDSALAVISRIRSDPVAPPTSLRTGVPMDLDRVVLRCLEKDPSHRFQHSDDLLAELRRLETQGVDERSDATTVAMSSQPPRRSTWRRRPALVAVVTLAVVVGVGWLLVRPEPRTQASPPSLIVVSEFVGPADDPSLATAVRALVTASLAQSGIVTPLSEDQMARVLRMAMKPDTTRVEGEVAYEVAVRSGAKLLVEGRIDRVMNGFTIVLHANDANSGNRVASVQGSASSVETLIPALDDLSRRLREHLGEEPSILRSTLQMTDVMTYSFAAYRELVLADEVKKKGLAMQSQLDHVRRALKLDPDFAEAWFFMSRTYNNFGRGDSARVALREAEKRPERFTTARLLHLRAWRARLDGDFVEYLRLYDLLLTHDPFNPDYHNGRANALNFLGRKEEALAGYEQADSLSFGGWAYVTNNILRMHIALGRYDPDSSLRTRVEPRPRRMFDLVITLAQSRWSESEALVARMVDDPTANRVYPNEALGSLAALRGEVGRAFSHFEEFGIRDDDRSYGFLRNAALLKLATKGLFEYPLIAEPDTASTRSLLRLGMQAVLQNDVQGGERNLEAIRNRADGRLRHSTDALVLEACILMARGKWSQVPPLLERFSTGGLRPVHLGRLPVRWIVAVAYEEMKQLERAAEAFELVLSPTYLSYEEQSRPIFWSFAHHRLVLLYAKMGRVDDARRHWEIFEKTFTDPDPELVPMVEEARRALEEAEAKAAS